jgi:hypothetical protein
MSKHDDLFIEACAMRGQILQYAIEIEVAFDMYISRHFTEDKTKQSELISLLLASRMTFDSKYQVFHYLVERYNPAFSKALPKFSNDFKKIIEWRNMFAHLPIDFSEHAIKAFEGEGKVSLVKLKNSKEYGLASRGTLTNTTLNGHINMIKKYANEIHKLLNI